MAKEVVLWLCWNSNPGLCVSRSHGHPSCYLKHNDGEWSCERLDVRLEATIFSLTQHLYWHWPWANCISLSDFSCPNGKVNIVTFPPVSQGWCKEQLIMHIIEIPKESSRTCRQGNTNRLFPRIFSALLSLWRFTFTHVLCEGTNWVSVMW